MKKEKSYDFKSIYLTFTKCLLNVMLVCGIIATLIIPFAIKWYGQINSYYAGAYFIPQATLFFVSGIFSCLIVYELRKIIRTIDEGNCFVRSNVKSLSHAGTYGFVIALCTAIRMFMYVTPGAFVVIIVFVLASLSAKVLSQVFDTAVTIKEDSDLTI